MDPYRQYLEEYVKEAYANSDGTNKGVSEYLWAKREPGRFASNKDIRIKALKEARRAYDEYRHWPPQIILSHLGIENRDEILKKK
jgi:hypothetical protein